MHDISDYIVHEELIEDHRKSGLRAGEGCVVELFDNSLLMLYGSFRGPSDEDKADLVEIRSTDGGLTWSDKKVFLAPSDDILNNMSVSMLPLQGGTIALNYLHKISTSECHPEFIKSTDNGKTWSKPVKTDSRGGYYVVNNDRMVQLKSGRILIPYAWHGDAPDFGKEGSQNMIGCFISDDNGESWRLSKQEGHIQKEDIVLPRFIDNRIDDILHDFNLGWVQCQEPGVVECSDGRIMLWVRTPGGYCYRRYSEDGGDTYSQFKPIAEFSMPCSPQSIKVLPGSNRMIMLFNDNKEIPYGHPQYGWRRPLSIGVSDDDGASWNLHGQLEPSEIPTNCYYSICFHNENVIFTYYEGVMMEHKSGLYVPKNLTSHKLKIVKQDYFKL
ncbi:MAG: sialidase family protein [Planctomycetota bacterium]|jgi:hypothetical protein